MKIGKKIGLKTSTAFVPPELAATLFRPTESLEELLADETRLEAESALEQKQTKKDRGKMKEIATQLQILSDKIAMLEKGETATEELRGSDKFDVWGFGAVMYEMLCKRWHPLLLLLRAYPLITCFDPTSTMIYVADHSSCARVTTTWS